ncbi:MAG: hypothetical protein JSR17_07670 [Proteobacteria bacterium]|nr:hypothetical protein [Pseudomonadota bacterium]
MSLDKNLPATIALKEMIALAIHLDKLCELAHFTLRYIERNPQLKNCFFVEDPQKLKALLNQLEAMRDLMPEGACDLSSRTQDSTYNAMFGNDVDSVYEDLTKKASPETIVGRFKTNINKLNTQAQALKSELEKANHQGLEVSAQLLGQYLWQQGQEALNALTKTKLFTYQQELENLNKQIEIINKMVKAKTNPTEGGGRKTQIFQEKSPTEKQLTRQTMTELLANMQNNLNNALHPGVAFEMIKKFIVTFEVHDELRHNPPGAKVIEQMITFLKNQCTPEQFKEHMADINKAVDSEVNERIDKGAKLQKGAGYKIESKYDDIIKKKKAAP